MGIFAVGDVVILPFPFSDLSSRKLRPAVVVAKADFSDLIFCQITSKDRSENGAIKLTPNNFKHGGLNLTSYARPDKLFTGDESIIVNTYGQLDDSTRQDLLSSIIALFKY
jgi:mRNA interferase MazF